MSFVLLATASNLKAGEILECRGWELRWNQSFYQVAKGDEVHKFKSFEKAVNYFRKVAGLR